MRGRDRRARPPLPFPIGAALEPVYRAIVGVRNRAFDAGRGVARLSCPVISVGNLSVGGTGKTPLVMRIAQWLVEAGRRPAIAMRGYGSARGEPSDEQEEYADRLPGVPVVAQPDRIAGLSPLVGSGLIDCVILDDGFQHRRIARDLDIVVIDATRDPFEDRCLPAGWLREPVASLRRADAVVVTHCERADEERVDAMLAQVLALKPSVVSACAEHDWASIVAGEAERATACLNGKPIVVMCAIGNSDAFVRACHESGAVVLLDEVRRDHHSWSAGEVRDIMVRAGAAMAARGLEAPSLLTTEKDWMRLRRLPRDVLSLPVLRARLRLKFREGERELHARVLQAARVEHTAGAREALAGAM